MLAKYNLLLGYIYEKIEFDVNYSNTSDIYLNKNVQQLIKEGYTIDNYLSNYNNDTSSRDYYGVTMKKEYDSTYTRPNLIFFDEEKNTYTDMLNDKKVQEYLNNGYYLSNYIKTSNGYIGAEFSKSTGYEYKTLIFDNVEELSNYTLFHKSEVQKLLNDGYKLRSTPYPSTCSTQGEICTSSYNSLVFVKSIEYDYASVILDVEYNSTTELLSALQNNEVYIKLIDEGYSISENYSNRYLFMIHTSGNVTYTNYTTKYFGALLSKKTGEVIEQESNTYEEKEYVYQDETAIGAHGDERGNPEFPEVGVWPYGNISDAEDALESGESYGGGGYYDFEYVKDTSEKKYFEKYKNTLASMGIVASSVSILSISEIDDIVYELTGNRLPLYEWWNNWNYVDDGVHDGYYIVGSLKEFLPSGYEWLYSTTYWTRTVESYSAPYQYFVDTLGNVCNGFACNLAVGAGFRPVVTISSEDIVYTITTKTDGNGTITPSAETEHSGNEVTFIVTPNEGFELKEVKVTDSNGNTITFTDYKFTMPDANVVIEAIFVAKNPETSAINIIVSIILGIISIGIIIKFKKKANWLNT